MNEEQRSKALAFLSDDEKVGALLADIDEDYKQPDYPREMLVDEVTRLRKVCLEWSRAATEARANWEAEVRALQRERDSERARTVRREP